MTADVLAFGSHPDDVEITCGGTIAKLVKQGHGVVIADLTQGELGTRGTKEIRAKEAEAAGRILGASRLNLGIPDGNIDLSQENLRKVISLIREVKPRTLLIPHSVERHPDHVHSSQLCREAWFYAGLAKIETTKDGTKQTAFRPQSYFEYMQWFEFQPSFIVDISDTFQVKMDAILAHSSQVHNPASKEPQTRLSQPEFLEMVEVRARYYGKRIGVEFGEPFLTYLPVGIKSIFDLVVNKG